MTVDQLKHEQAERKSLIAPARMFKRMGSVRVSYGFIVAVVCWFALVAALYFLKTLGFIDGR